MSMIFSIIIKHSAVCIQAGAQDARAPPLAELVVLFE